MKGPSRGRIRFKNYVVRPEVVQDQKPSETAWGHARRARGLRDCQDDHACNAERNCPQHRTPSTMNLSGNEKRLPCNVDSAPAPKPSIGPRLRASSAARHIEDKPLFVSGCAGWLQVGVDRAASRCRSPRDCLSRRVCPFRACQWSNCGPVFSCASRFLKLGGNGQRHPTLWTLGPAAREPVGKAQFLPALTSNGNRHVLASPQVIGASYRGAGRPSRRDSHGGTLRREAGRVSATTERGPPGDGIVPPDGRLASVWVGSLGGRRERRRTTGDGGRNDGARRGWKNEERGRRSRPPGGRAWLRAAPSPPAPLPGRESGGPHPAHRASPLPEGEGKNRSRARGRCPPWRPRRPWRFAVWRWSLGRAVSHRRRRGRPGPGRGRRRRGVSGRPGPACGPGCAG